MISHEILQNFLVSYIYIHYIRHTNRRKWWIDQAGKDHWSGNYLMSCDVIYYLKEGSFELTVGDQVYQVKREQLVYLPANTKFHLQITSDEPLVFYYVHAELEIGSKRIHEIFDFPYLCDPSDPQATESLFMKLMQVFNGDSSIAALEANATYLQLVCHYLKESNAAPLLQTKQVSNLQKTVEYIHANLSHSFTVKELAQMAGYSPAHFSRRFKQSFGKAPLEYITYIRVKYAQKRLQKTDFSIAEIAEELGYSDIGYFSSLFKKYIGVTPASYRKNKLWKI